MGRGVLPLLSRNLPQTLPDLNIFLPEQFNGNEFIHESAENSQWPKRVSDDLPRLSLEENCAPTGNGSVARSKD